MASLRYDSPVKGSCFFKIILSDIDSDGKLMIPTKFVRNYGKKLADCVFLQATSGAVWQVELERTNGVVWLHKGWQEFAAYYSLCFGHLLVFQYEGNSQFHVLIFDSTATEIEYPASTTHSEGCWVRKMQENADTSENKRMRTEHSDEPDNTNNRKTNDFPFQSTGIQHNRMKPTNLVEGLDSYGSEQGDRANGVSGLRLASKVEKARALASAKAFNSENPFFMAKMRPSYVAGRTDISVSKDFVERYITKDKGNVILQLTDGRTWRVKCTLYPCNAKLCCGWTKFARDNDLVVGDVCVFELISRTKNLLRVVIFRAAKSWMKPINLEEDLDSYVSEDGENGVSGLQFTSNHEKARALASAKAFKSENPFFMVTMRPSHVSGFCVTLRKTFAERYITKDCCNVVLQVTGGGRTWPVKCSLYSTNAKLLRGWNAFAIDNNLGVGDVCIFELINPTEHLLKVVIFRAK